jgi:opacity protein-like surface antigen
MKKIITITSVALLASFSAAPVIADSNGIKAVVGVSYGHQEIHSTDSDLDSGGGSIRHEFARVAIPVSDVISIQLDAERESYNQSGEDKPQSSSALGAHVSYKVGDAGLVGLFYARGIAEASGVENEDGWIAGLEGQYYVNDEITLYSQIGSGRIRTDDHEGFIEDGHFERIVARYFPSDDTKLEIDFSNAGTKSYIDGHDNGRFIAIAINAETRLLDSMPLYGTAKLRRSRFHSASEDDSAKDTSFMLGVNYRFGVSSLKDNDKNGVTLDMPMQPIRAAGFAEGLD